MLLRGVGYVVVGLLAVVVIAGGAVFGADTWRAHHQRPADCRFDLQGPRGDLLADDDVVQRAWAALTTPDTDADGDLVGSRPVMERSCVLYAGAVPAGRTVVFADVSVAGQQAVTRIVEVRLPADPDGEAQRAVASHSTGLGAELGSGVILPLSGAYLVPDVPGGPVGSADTGNIVDAVTVLTAADGYAAATTAERIGDGLFDVGIADGMVATANGPQDPDALLLLQTSIGGPLAVAVPVGPERERPLPARATYELTVNGAAPADEATLRTAGPVLSLMSADPRYSLIRDRALRPPGLDVIGAPGAVTIAAVGPSTRLLPAFVLATAPPSTGLLQVN